MSVTHIRANYFPPPLRNDKNLSHVILVVNKYWMCNTNKPLKILGEATHAAHKWQIIYLFCPYLSATLILSFCVHLYVSVWVCISKVYILIFWLQGSSYCLQLHSFLCLHRAEVPFWSCLGVKMISKRGEISRKMYI